MYFFGKKETSATKFARESERFHSLRGSVLAFHCSSNPACDSSTDKRKMLTFYQWTDGITYMNQEQNILITRDSSLFHPSLIQFGWINIFVLKFKLGEFVFPPECKSPSPHTLQLKGQPSRDLSGNLLVCRLLFLFFTLLVPVFKAFW